MDRKVHEFIRLSLANISDATRFFDVTEKGLEAVFDSLQILQDYEEYINQLDKELTEQFWDSLATSFEKYLLRDKNILSRFIEKPKDNPLPDYIKTRLRNAVPSPEDDLDGKFAVVSTMAMHMALQDDNSFIRDKLVKWSFEKALEAQDLRQWIFEITVHLGNLIYGDDLLDGDSITL